MCMQINRICAWRNAWSRVTASRIVHLQEWFLRINLNRQINRQILH